MKVSMLKKKYEDYFWNGIDQDDENFICFDVLEITPKAGKAAILYFTKENVMYRWSVQYCGTGHYFRTYEELIEYCEKMKFKHNKEADE